MITYIQWDDLGQELFWNELRHSALHRSSSLRLFVFFSLFFLPLLIGPLAPTRANTEIRQGRTITRRSPSKISSRCSGSVGQQQIWQSLRKTKMEKVVLSGSLPRSSIHGRSWIYDRDSSDIWCSWYGQNSCSNVRNFPDPFRCSSDLRDLDAPLHRKRGYHENISVVPFDYREYRSPWTRYWTEMAGGWSFPDLFRSIISPGSENMDWGRHLMELFCLDSSKSSWWVDNTSDVEVLTKAD